MISRRGFLVGSAAALAPNAAGARTSLELSDILYDPELPVLGNPQGDVTIAEFFDYACPYCKVLHPDLKQILREDPAIRLVMKDWPINGDLASYASRMVLAADKLGYYKTAHLAVIGISGKFGQRAIDGSMRTKGIDVGKVRDTLDIYLEEINALLARNTDQARGLSLLGTPSFIIGTKLYREPLNPEQIRQAVAQARHDQNIGSRTHGAPRS